MSIAAGLLAIALAFALPTACLIALIWAVVNWTTQPEPPPGGDTGPGGLRTRPRPSRPHGGPDRRQHRKTARPPRRPRVRA